MTKPKLGEGRPLESRKPSEVKEKVEMRRFVLTIAAAAAMFSAGAFTADRADAMAIGTPSGLVAAIEGVDLAEDVAYVCRKVWRCGYRGCGWRRVCSWRPGPYRPYRPHRRYYR